MKNRTSARAVISSMLTIAALGSIGTVAVLTGSEPDTTTRTRNASAEASVTPVADRTSPRTVERQHGLVMEGYGELNGAPVSVTVYENSMYGNSLQVVLGDPEDDQIGYLEQQAPFVTAGALSATVEVNGDLVTLSGTVEATGRPELTTSPLQDAGKQIVSQGTRTQLATDVTLQLRGERVPLSFAPAFAYDLEVQRVDLYAG